jgi:hypothetical protein
MTRYAWLILALLTAGCAFRPPPVVTPAPVPRTLAIHSCVPNATIWLDGAQVPPLRGTADPEGTLTFPAFPSNVSALNVHATAPGYPDYGAVVTIVAGTDPLILIVGQCVK